MEAGPFDANAAAFDPDADDVFARIAGRCDRLCDIFSLFAHRLWKARMAKLIAAERGAIALDVASGTGDIPVRVLRCADGPEKILVTDICPQMLAQAREKLGGAPRAELRRLDAHRLDLPEESVFAAELTQLGFRDVTYENLTLGIVAIHRGVKPS